MLLCDIFIERITHFNGFARYPHLKGLHVVTMVTNSLLTHLRLQDKLIRPELIRRLPSLVGKGEKLGQKRSYYLPLYLALYPGLRYVKSGYVPIIILY